MMGARAGPKSIRQPSPPPSPATRAGMGVGLSAGRFKASLSRKSCETCESIPNCPSSICSSPENRTCNFSKYNVSIFLVIILDPLGSYLLRFIFLSFYKHTCKLSLISQDFISKVTGWEQQHAGDGMIPNPPT